jgi:hypothetical protein
MNGDVFAETMFRLDTCLHAPQGSKFYAARLILIHKPCELSLVGHTVHVFHIRLVGVIQMSENRHIVQSVSPLVIRLHLTLVKHFIPINILTAISRRLDECEPDIVLGQF